MSLLAMQRSFGAWLRDGGDAAADAIGFGYRPGLDVYLNNYRAQLAASLETGFAHTRAWMGDDAFHDAIVIHVDRVPPSGWTLDHYGRDFPMTLAALHPDHEEVAELAWAEWAIGEAFVAPDHDAVDAASLGGVDWDRAVLLLSPTIRLADVSTNVFDIWLALTEERAPPPARALADRQTLLVWRLAQTCQVRLMDAAEAGAFRSALSGAAFPALCAALVASHGEQDGVALAGTLLGRWIGEGLIVGVDCRGTSPRRPQIRVERCRD